MTDASLKYSGPDDDRCRFATTLAIGLFSLGLAATTLAGPREQAKRIHDRLAGVPPSESVLQAMQSDIAGGNPLAAASRAMDDPNFYNVTLKNFAAPWTNRARSVFVPLNDYIATVVGMIRDDVPFNTLLSADIIYVSNDGSLPPYSNANNNHYEELENRGIDMMSTLQQRTQSSVTGLPPQATAGVMTTRAAAEAFFVAGTNRAMFRFTLLNHMCNDMEQMIDLTLVPDRIRQDVSRSPGGDSRLFLNNCIGCHSGMDPLAGAFAYYNFNEDTGSIEYTPGVVQPKYFNNDVNFPFGYRTTDDSWLNYWREGQNSYFGWDSGLPGSGNGAKSLGEELASSDAFASCQVKKVFRAVCLREPEDATDRAQVDSMVASFQSGYNMKQTFAEAAVYCMGQ
ncbi:MAG: hypothetical protein R3315_00010 [Woeseiaceae bacterium]|nr:hypothetical protein [Woeseiaceae bacterium]